MILASQRGQVLHDSTYIYEAPRGVKFPGTESRTGHQGLGEGEVSVSWGQSVSAETATRSEDDGGDGCTMGMCSTPHNWTLIDG